jgi:hypothetical protein
MKIVGHVVFSRALDGSFPNPDGAAVALEGAGYVEGRRLLHGRRLHRQAQLRSLLARASWLSAEEIEGRARADRCASARAPASPTKFMRGSSRSDGANVLT